MSLAKVGSKAARSGRSVDPGQGRAWVVLTEYGELVTGHEDLDVFGWAGSGEQRQPAQHPGEQQTDESEDHSERACSAGCGVATVDHVDAARHRGLPCAAPSTCRALGRIGRRRRDVRVGRVADGRPGGSGRGGAQAGRGRRSSRPTTSSCGSSTQRVADARNARAGRRPRRVSGRALGGGGADSLCAGPDVRRSGARPGRSGALRLGPVGPWVYAYP